MRERIHSLKTQIHNIQMRQRLEESGRAWTDSLLSTAVAKRL